MSRVNEPPIAAGVSPKEASELLEELRALHRELELAIGPLNHAYDCELARHFPDLGADPSYRRYRRKDSPELLAKARAEWSRARDAFFRRVAELSAKATGGQQS